VRRAAAALLLLVAGLSWAAPAGDLRTRVRVLEELLDDEDYVAARAALDKLRQGNEKNESFDFFAGRLAFGEGRYADAVSALELAGVEDRPGSYLRLARDTLAITRDHERAESEHFIFLYPKGKDSILAPYALETLEAQRAALAHDLGHAPPGKVGSRW
jgi:uncharacterized protein (DUF1810 family)